MSASSKLIGNDLSMAIIKMVAEHDGKYGTYDTSMIRQVFDFCWDQLGWRASDNEMAEVISELADGLAK